MKKLTVVVALLLLIATAGALAFTFLWAGGRTVIVTHWANGHLMREGDKGEEIRLLPVMAAEFNKAGHRTPSGARIVVEVRDVPSELQAEYLVPRELTGTRIDLVKLSGGYVKPGVNDPTIVTPSDAHWMVTVNYQVGRELVDLDAAPALVRPYVGIVTYEEMARCLGWPVREVGYSDIIALRTDPRGWAAYPCAKAEWGQRPLLAFTDPTTSSTGRSVLFSLYSFASGKPPEQLTIEDVGNPSVVKYVREFQSLIDHYMIGTTALNTKVYQGPRYGHFFIMPEDNLIHLYEGTEKAIINGVKVTAPPISQRMVMIYPKEGSMPRNNCACVVEAAWVSEEQAAGARVWTRFLLEDRQQRSFMDAGLRPGTDIPLTDPDGKISPRYGLTPAEPKTVLKPSLVEPAVAAAIDSSWADVKRPGIVSFVLDTSGSMSGPKLEQAREGVIRALDAMAVNNQVGFLTFGDRVIESSRVPVASIQGNRFRIAEAADQMRASGGTPLYDGIREGVRQTMAVEGPPDAIRAVVVLTDGRANQGVARLDDLVTMSSRNEVPIRSWAGFENSPGAVDARGRSVPAAEVVGTGLALKTEYPVQIFFIGIGDDADLQIGRVLAEATGAEFQGAAEKDLASVLEEFSKYF